MAGYFNNRPKKSNTLYDWWRMVHGKRYGIAASITHQVTADHLRSIFLEVGYVVGVLSAQQLAIYIHNIKLDVGVTISNDILFRPDGGRIIFAERLSKCVLLSDELHIHLSVVTAGLWPNV